jgi:arylsulfatase A-like enzyme
MSKFKERRSFLTVLIFLPLLLPLMLNAKPNVVLILVDDAGFMDFGGYGGEANTPNINRIADEGVRFSNYHTSPLCATSRAMLLTGLDSHMTGIGTIPEMVTEEQAKNPEYALRLLPGVQTIADDLSAAGYETFMTGKWHLGRGEGDLPDSHGFDRSFALDASGADNWEQKTFIPFYNEAPWFEDGEPANLPNDFYSSRFLVDKMMEYLDAGSPDKPFFAYIAFQAIHIPVQAPREYTDHYKGVYSDGWHATLNRRFESAKSLGLVPEDAAPPDTQSSFRDWGDLSDQERMLYERSMMVNAGMLEAMDFHVGRLIEYLESRGELENTIVIVTSDNGPEFGDPAVNSQFKFWMSQNGYDNDIDHLGEKGSMVAIGPEWASAAAAPGSLFKFYASEGGTRVPLIIRVPGLKRDGFVNSFNFVTDISPTIAELAGLAPRDNVTGKSLMPVLRAERQHTYDENEPVGLETSGNSALFKGRYKLTRNVLPLGDANWRLHDLSTDPAETQDLSGAHPELREEMLADYKRYATEVGVLDLPADFNIGTQLSLNVRNKFIENNLVPIALLGCIILAVLALIGYGLYRRVHRIQ